MIQDIAIEQLDIHPQNVRYGECDMQRESGKCPLDRLN